MTLVWSLLLVLFSAMVLKLVEIQVAHLAGLQTAADAFKVSTILLAAAQGFGFYHLG